MGLSTFNLKIIEMVENGHGKLINFVALFKDMKTFTAIIHKEEEMYVAKCPEVGTVSQGNSIEQALENLKEATTLYLEEFPMKKVSRPILTTFEVVEVEA